MTTTYIDELSIKQISDIVQQLKKMLENKEINETCVYDGKLFQRITRFSLNGISRTNWTPTNISDNVASTMSFSGNVWIGGKKITVPTTGTTQYLKITFGSSPSACWVDAMPEDMDSDSEVFDINETPGDLHLPANMA